MPITSALSMLLEIAQRKCATQIHAYFLPYLPDVSCNVHTETTYRHMRIRLRYHRLSNRIS